MRKLTDLLRGYTRLRVTGGAPQWCLNRLTAERIPFWGTEFIDPFTLEVNVYSRDAAAAQNAAQRAMCDAETIAVRGFRSRYYGLLRRPVLLAFTALAILCALIVPNRVWLLGVEGNENIPSEKILRAVRDAGVGIGVYGPNVKPQLIRYRVLNDIPELLWLTVTQNGASAVVTVREKQSIPRGAPRDAMRNMVAIRGGLITDDLMAWMETQAKQAQQDGKKLIAMMHHHLMEHFTLEQRIDGFYILDNHKEVCEKFDEWNIRVTFTGHLHWGDIAEYQGKHTIYDATTCSLATYPLTYRDVTFTAVFEKQGATIIFVEGISVPALSVGSECLHSRPK